MDENIPQEILHDLLSAFEALETQTAAILEFLKAKGIATEEELAPYLEQAGNASNVRWLAAKVRMDRLISSALKAAEADAKKEPAKTETDQPSRPTGETQEKTQTKLQAAEPDTKKEPAKTEAGQPSRATGEVKAQEEKAQEQTQTKPSEKQTEKAVHAEQQESVKEDALRATDGGKQEGKQEEKQEEKNDKQTDPDNTEPNPTKKPASGEAA